MLQFKTEINWVYPAPSTAWKKFFAVFPEIVSLTYSSWHPVHYISYFATKFQEFYGRSYSFSYLGVPSKCQEMVFIKKVMSALGGPDPELYINFIDWVFGTRIKTPESYQIKSISFLLYKGLINEFFAFQQRKAKNGNGNGKLSRAAQLPDQYLEVALKHNLELSTYGDLAFLYQYNQQNPQSEYTSFLQEVLNQGFDFNILDFLS